MKISLVIPIYKVEEQCFNKLIISLNNQKYHNMFECIFVIDEINSKVYYEKSISNLAQDIVSKTIQNEKNLGSGGARNKGIDLASGEYLTFIDSDDNISCDYMEKIFEFFKEHESDLIRINYTKNCRAEWMSAITQYKYFSDSIIPGWASYTMLISKTFIEKHEIRFPPGSSYGEDIYLFLLIMCNVTWWYEINTQTYFYNRENENSITTLMHKNYLKTFFTIRKIIKLSKQKLYLDKQIEKFKFYKKYIWKRSFKNFVFAFFHINRENI